MSILLYNVMIKSTVASNRRKTTGEKLIQLALDSVQWRFLSCGRAIQPSDSISEFLGHLSNYKLLKEDLYHAEFYLLGHKAVQSIERQPTFQRNMSPPSSG
jgi:hypothetical protein